MSGPASPMELPAPQQQTLDSQPKPRGFLRRSLAVGATAAALLAVATICPSSESTVQGISQAPGVSTLHAENNTMCPSVSQDDINEVVRLFDQPETPGLILPPSMKNSGELSSKVQKAAAQKYGLQFFDYSSDPYVQDLFTHNEKPSSDAHEAFKLYFDAAKHVAANYGITLSANDNKRQYPTGTHSQNPIEFPADNREFNTVNPSDNMVNVMVYLSKMPVERVRASGITNIVAANFDGNIIGEADEEQHTYYVNLTADFISDNLFRHEGAHLEDNTLCGGGEKFANDPQFANANPVDIYHIKAKTGYISEATFQQEQKTVEQNPGNNPPNFLDEEAARVVVLNDDAFNNVIEDKAAIGADLSDPNYFPLLLDKKKPVLRQKALIYLARLFHQNPNVVRYYAETTPRTFHKDFVINRPY